VAKSVFGEGTLFAGAPLANNALSAVSMGRRTRTVFELRAAIGFVGFSARAIHSN
jgi:hypothetical protein